MKKVLMVAALVAGSVSLAARADALNQKASLWHRLTRWQRLLLRPVWQRTIRLR